jgi:hypothetical protein
MKSNRVHYTWEKHPIAGNSFAPLQIGHKPKQKSKILSLLGFTKLLSKLKLGGN